MTSELIPALLFQPRHEWSITLPGDVTIHCEQTFIDGASREERADGKARPVLVVVRTFLVKASGGAERRYDVVHSRDGLTFPESMRIS